LVNPLIPNIYSNASSGQSAEGRILPTSSYQSDEVRILLTTTQIRASLQKAEFYLPVRTSLTKSEYYLLQCKFGPVCRRQDITYSNANLGLPTAGCVYQPWQLSGRWRLASLQKPEYYLHVPI